MHRQQTLQLAARLGQLPESERDFGRRAFELLPYVGTPLVRWWLGLESLSGTRRALRSLGVVPLLRDGRCLWDLRDIRDAVDRRCVLSRRRSSSPVTLRHGVDGGAGQEGVHVPTVGRAPAARHGSDVTSRVDG